MRYLGGTLALRALIADDHELFREGLKGLLETSLGASNVLQAGSLDEALDMIAAAESPPDLLVLDLKMPGVTGAEAFSALRDAFKDTKIVVMSASEERSDILAALSGGVHGYIPKSLAVSQIEAALQEVLGGRIYAPAALGERSSCPPPAKVGPPIVVEGLTGRQRDVLSELLKGLSSKEIARNLHIAEGTVKIHLAAIYRAVGVRTRAEAIAKLNMRQFGAPA
jgi:DNA-binding NarL/FixJ family response regulator